MWPTSALWLLNTSILQPLSTHLVNVMISLEQLFSPLLHLHVFLFSFSKSKGQVIRSCDVSYASHVMNQVTSHMMGHVHITWWLANTSHAPISWLQLMTEHQVLMTHCQGCSSYSWTPFLVWWTVICKQQSYDSHILNVSKDMTDTLSVMIYPMEHFSLFFPDFCAACTWPSFSKSKGQVISYVMCHMQVMWWVRW
jgi:hypothetical protein